MKGAIYEVSNKTKQSINFRKSLKVWCDTIIESIDISEV